MMSRTVTLFLVVATTVSGRIIQTQRHFPQEMLFMPALSRGWGLQPVPVAEPCEPDFVPEVPKKNPVLPPLPSIVIPKLPEPCLDEVAVPEIPIAVPQPPALPAFMMPELSRVEAPMLEPCLENIIPAAPIPEYIPSALPLPIVEPVFVPEMPVVKIPAAPELPPLEMPAFPEISMQPEPCFDEVVIPEIPYQHVPQLTAAIIMPELSVKLETPMSEPCLEDQVVPVAPIPEYIPPAPMPLPIVPQAPELPAFVMPELPVRVEAPIPEPCLEDLPNPAPMPEYIPLPAPMPLPIVPQAPELPAFVMPELPVRVETPIPEPCLEDLTNPAPMPEYIPLPALMPVPIAVPQAPELPAFVMPQIPIRVDAPIPEPCVEDLPVAPIPEYIPPAPMPLPAVPQAPELPVFVMPELPVRVETPIPEPCLEDLPIPVPVPEYIPLPAVKPFEPAFVPEKPVFVPMAPELPALPIRAEPPIIGPCPEDLPAISIPEYIQPIALPAAPKLPKTLLPKIPVRVDIEPAMTKPEDPCVIGEVAIVVPQQPKFPKPIAMPMYPGLAADPCEPSAVKMAELPPYIVRQPTHKPSLPMPIGFYNHLPAIGAIPHHLRHFK